MAPSSEELDDLVRRITSGVRPSRIILFGSAARGDMGPDSDLDVLVVMPDGCDRLAVSQAIYRLLRGVGYPKDVVVSESDVARLGSNPHLAIHTALTEGKELYRAASSRDAGQPPGLAGAGAGQAGAGQTALAGRGVS